MACLASQGYSVKTTQLSEEFSYKTFQEKYQQHALVLFTFDGKGHVAPVRRMEDLKPENDWALISLVPPQARKERKDKEPASE